MLKFVAVLLCSVVSSIAALAQNTPTPTSYTNPVIDFTGRYLDSTSTPDFQGPRTLRAGELAIAPELDRIFTIASGGMLGAYRLSSFFDQTLGSAMAESAQGDQYLPFLMTFDVFAPDSGWQTRLVDGSQFLADFDWNDAGIIALAASDHGWGLVDLHGTLIYQMFTPPTTPRSIELVRAGGKDYVLVGSSSTVDVYDLTDPAAPALVRTLPIGGREFAATADDGLVGIVTWRSELLVYTVSSLIAGLEPLGTFERMRAITADADRLYAAGDRILVARFDDGALVESSYQGGGAVISVGAGYLTTWSYPGPVPYSEMFTFYSLADGAPSRISNGGIGEFYGNQPYSQNARDMALTEFEGRTYFMAAMHGLGDVYELAAAPAELAIAKSASAATVDVGAQVTYTISVSNSGAGSATGVQVIDTLPAGMSLVSTSSLQGTCTGSSTIACDIPLLAPGETATIEILVRVDAPGSYVNSASVTGTGDTDSSNNEASAPTVEVAAADLVIAKTVEATQVQVGGEVMYTIIARNEGPGSASEVRIIDSLPPGMTLSSVSAEGAVCEGDSTVTCTVPLMSSGDTVTVRILARIAAPGSFVNTARISSPADASPANNTASAPAVTAMAASSVPTLSEYSLLVLAMCLVALAWRVIR